MSIPGMSRLRSQAGMDIQVVGDYRPRLGGIEVEMRLVEILLWASVDTINPYTIHHDYEELHPFMDGNGRSGRLLWLWQVLKFNYSYSPDWLFLRAWYYHSLSERRR